MNDGIVPRSLGAEARKDPLDISHLQKLSEIVDEPGKWLVVEVGSGDSAEEATEERVRTGNFVGGIASFKWLVASVVGASGEKSVGDRLSEHVGEIADGEVRDKH